MKEPNIGTPVEDDIRKHYPALKDTPIEIIPHTKIWATEAGVLLWDPKNGYGDITAAPAEVSRKPYPRQGRKPDYISTTNDTIIMPVLKRVVYLTGPALSGKSHLVSMMHDAIELNRGSFIGFTDLSRTITKYDNHETVVISNNSTTPTAFNLDNALNIWCRERKIEYLHINLTSI
jgi:hypothetical protein